MKASTMLSKLGNLTAAESTELLTSTINSYKMASEEAVSVVDRLVAVDNVSATSSRELAVALRYVAASASEAGVTLNQMISYIATISSVTRLNAEQIGQAIPGS
jgi:TP901 family phage tail tape measure protein